jgi:hypothetical protein
MSDGDWLVTLEQGSRTVASAKVSLGEAVMLSVPWGATHVQTPLLRVTQEGLDLFLRAGMGGQLSFGPAKTIVSVHQVLASKPVRGAPVAAEVQDVAPTPAPNGSCGRITLADLCVVFRECKPSDVHGIEIGLPG